MTYFLLLIRKLTGRSVYTLSGTAYTFDSLQLIISCLADPFDRIHVLQRDISRLIELERLALNFHESPFAGCFCHSSHHHQLILSCIAYRSDLRGN